MIDCVIKISDGMVGDEQKCFIPGKGCVDKVFTLRQLVDKA